MKVDTLNFGEVEIEEGSVYSFQQGIPGFESLHDFVIIELDKESPFAFLQSTEQQDFSMIITNPFDFYPHYELELSESTKKELFIEKKEDVMVWNTITISGEVKHATINLLAPIIMNSKKKCGKQIVLLDSDYQTKHKLIPDHTPTVRGVK